MKTQEKEITNTRIRKKEIKLFLFIDEIIVFVENLKESTKKQKTPRINMSLARSKDTR